MTPLQLTEARENVHLTQRDLARVLGVRFTTVNRWERGHTQIPPMLHLVFKDRDYWFFQAELSECHKSTQDVDIEC